MTVYRTIGYERKYGVKKQFAKYKEEMAKPTGTQLHKAFLSAVADWIKLYNRDGGTNSKNRLSLKDKQQLMVDQLCLETAKTNEPSVLHPCGVCEVQQSAEHYTDSMWQHRKQRPAVCKKCEAAKDLHPCIVCEEQRPAEHYTDSMWHNRKQQPAICKFCQAAQAVAVHPCAVCGLQQPRQGYGRSMWHNRTRRQATCTQCVAGLK